jgi:hypothetical protein
MTSTYTVEHDNGTSTIEGVHAFWFPAGHLVFLNEEGNAFAGFAADTWYWFKKVEVAEPVNDVLTRDQVFALPVGTRVKATGNLSEFEVVEGGVAWVTYSGGDPRPVECQHYSDLSQMPDITEFKVIA